MKKGVCCIVLSLEPKKFKTITYKRFSELPRSNALSLLGERILNNLEVTRHAINYCHKNNHNYRLSSSLFPLITYEKANVSLQELPNYNQIEKELNNIKETIQNSNVRISIHPSEYNVLGSRNEDAVKNTIKELNFQGWFLSRIGCEKNYNSPINLHVNNMEENPEETLNRFLGNAFKLNDDVLKRLVLENDDKQSLWSVKKLIKYFHPYGFPITFDYLHHKCHSDDTSEEEAFHLCYRSWGSYKPLFHYSESAKGQSNPRKHGDYAEHQPNTYNNNDIDIDYEFKMKEKSFL